MGMRVIGVDFLKGVIITPSFNFKDKLNLSIPIPKTIDGYYIDEYKIEGDSIKINKLNNYSVGLDIKFNIIQSFWFESWKKNRFDFYVIAGAGTGSV